METCRVVVLAISTVIGGEIEEILDRVVGRVGTIDGVAAIALGGSRARGTADRHSDVDLGIYYDGERPFSIGALDRAARDLDDRHISGLVTDFGAWGPGVNGGGWLTLDGVHVDFLYRDLGAVARAIDECLEGRVHSIYQLGHPLGFQNQIYAGETQVCQPLYDPLGALVELKAKVADYPEPLRATIVAKHLFDAEFELSIAGKPAARCDTMYVAGCLFRAAGFMVRVLYALNRTFFINEKGAMAESRGFALVPHGFHDSVDEVLGRPGAIAAELAESIARMQQILDQLKLVANERTN
ncbi:MAG TPA: nucleotidyltransferase domain-containing protein [Candidatus Binataceae bacterium]|nr:nucleotidyltransferase domain-containing protein [Candidatus Binataceae bacterium]